MTAVLGGLAVLALAMWIEHRARVERWRNPHPAPIPPRRRPTRSRDE